MASAGGPRAVTAARPAGAASPRRGRAAPAPAGRRLPRLERERQILRIGEELFCERGYAGASMDELARRVGVSKPVIYDLVGSKEQLFRSAVERASEDLTDRVVSAWSGAETLERRFRAGAEAFFRFVDEHRAAWSMLLSASAAPEAAEPVDSTRRRQADLMRTMLIEASGGRLTAERADGLAHAINGAFEAAATWWPRAGGPPPAEMAEMLATLLLPGLSAALEAP